jgi:hypothetical protein
MKTIFREKQEAHIRAASAPYVQAVAERQTVLAFCQSEALAERATLEIRLLLDNAGIRQDKIHATANTFAYQDQHIDLTLCIRLEKGEPGAPLGDGTIEAHNMQEFLCVMQKRPSSAHIITAEASILGSKARPRRHAMKGSTKKKPTSSPTAC